MDVEIKTPVGNINVNMTQDNIKKLLDFAYENAVIESNDSDINKQETVPKESEENSGGYAKEPTTEFWCTCGEKSELPEILTQAILRCECGSIWKYRTNATDDVIEYNCISCGAPVDMQYNQKRNRYETIN